MSDAELPVKRARSSESVGLFYGLFAYLLWGAFPAYFTLLEPASAFEIVATRIVFTLAFCVIVITVLRRWGAIVAIVKRPKTLGVLGIAAIIIIVNWQVVIVGALLGHFTEIALGFFMNPVITVLLGVVFLREKLRPLQWVAIGVSVVAVVVLALNYGAFPWIGVLTAVSFSLYALVKRQVGQTVDALSGLAIEGAWLLPISIVMLIIINANGALTFGTAGPWHTVAMISTGIVTGVPLLLFAATASRVRLVYIGFLQFMSPVITLVLGIGVLHEDMPPVRWIGFVIVVIAVIILTIDAVRHSRSQRVVPELT